MASIPHQFHLISHFIISHCKSDFDLDLLTLTINDVKGLCLLPSNSATFSHVLTSGILNSILRR